MNKSSKTMYLATAGIIAAIYTVLCIALKPISYGEIQARVSEALCILPIFTPAAIPGLTIGCLLANFLGGAAIPDVIFGTLATLIGALGTYALRRSPKLKYLASVPPIVSNTIIIPFVLRYAYGVEGGIPILMLSIGIGEIIACGVLGTLFMLLLMRTKLYRYFYSDFSAEK